MADIPSVSKVRLKYGPAVTLIDLSNGGAQIETTNFRMQPGAAVVVELTASQGDIAIPATVLRCQLASLLPEPVYRGALVFRKPFDVRTLGVDEVGEEPEVELDPATEYQRLRTVLERLSIGTDDRVPAVSAQAIEKALEAAFAVLQSPAGKRAGAALGEELAEMFNAVGTALEGGPTARALMAAIEEHLSHVVPARAVRTADPDTFVQLPGSEAIMLTVPALSPDLAPMRLAVEFPDGTEPQELHFQVLKAGIQLVAIARELGRLNGDEVPLAIRSTATLPSGWSRIVVRYNHGQLHKGYTHTFQPARGYVTVMPAPVDDATTRIMVPFTDVKAVFFVKDLTGNHAYQEHKLPDPTAPAQVTVTFRDGEQLVGRPLDYQRQAPGFFLEPSDPRANNDRVYVVASAVAQLKFL